MKLRVLQVLFVAASLLFAALIVRQGRPHLLPPAQGQGQAEGDPRGHAPEASPAERKAAVSAIQAQLDAFRKGDFSTAIRYQSEGLKRQFPSPAAFRQMMQTEYPAFLHFRSVTFRGARTPDGGGHLFVLVLLQQADGSLTRAVYLMVREGSVYRVDGVGGGEGPGGGPGPGFNGMGGPSRMT